jgi:amino acid transporter
MLACCVGASRLIYALGRDGVSLKVFDNVHAKRGTPTNATYAVTGGILAILVLAYLLLRGGILASWQDATGFAGAPTTLAIFAISGTTGTLILLVVYGLATLGVIALARRGGGVKAHEVVIPVLALAVLGYTLFRNVWPLPSGAGWWAPAITVVWLLAGVIWVFVRSDATREAGLLLLQDEGLNTSSAKAGEESLPEVK